MHNTAYSPGLLALMWLGTHVGLTSAATGLLVPLAAALAAGLALTRFANDVGANPEYTVAARMIAPMAVYLITPYTEALFAAFSFWAWVQACCGTGSRQERWADSRRRFAARDRSLQRRSSSCSCSPEIDPGSKA